MSKKEEASTVNNVVTPDCKLLLKGRKKKDEASSVPKVGAMAGVKIDRTKFNPSFRTKGKHSPVQRHRKKMHKNKNLGSKKIGEATFAESVVAQLLGLKEVVRKQGNKWVIYDDQTGVQIGSSDTRKSAWDQQRVHRQQAKFRKGEKGKKKKLASNNPRKPTKAPKPKLAKAPKKAQLPQTVKTPKVKNVRGIKKIKPISPLRPIRPKGLGSKKKKNREKPLSFESVVALGILRESN